MASATGSESGSCRLGSCIMSSSAVDLKVSFVVTVNNHDIFNSNFLASPALACFGDYQLIVQEKFSSAAKAYNDAIEHSTNDLIIFCHQDVILPRAWYYELGAALERLAASDPNWGVLGCSGQTVANRGWGHVYSSGVGIIGSPFADPARVQTLDEIVLILRKSSGLRFDPSLPHFHFYGTDICLRAGARGLHSYAISAFCIHNTHQSLILPAEFYECYWYIKTKWNQSLPIQTTCIRITKYHIPMYLRRLRELYLRYIKGKEVGGYRTDDTECLLRTCAKLVERSGATNSVPSLAE